ncbi:diphosphate--fructose-6-phosphate 1-phosphotransferase [Parachlamydia sp. AcF125]|uniref:diphosphate--fructose-6-phosphate 1-phosphotransferase n=1 Tax=Parachlamydia sp. AcF125 TaxID=2795736 RepID=UPI001BC8CCC8|nr:diphosphate--fructose-6-phosphate 1-phosphotransferase [Parachlamydia sp. AcF125]MBS4168475.1 Pyrophosphate--fructose 6-phosphate 1-phosphotransferase [Parachlamydia sp. AcF125]
MRMHSSLQKKRLAYLPRLPEILQPLSCLVPLFEPNQKAPQLASPIIQRFPKTIDQKPLRFVVGENKTHKPLKVGVVFSGGQASGGHNVVSGLFDALKKLNPASTVYGFLNGPGGIIQNQFIEITADLIDHYRNLGGFDLIGSGRTKIETPDQFQAVLKTVQGLHLDGLVIVGGDDSNTNAAFLAEYFLVKGCKTCVVGVPKTIDGDLKNESIEVSFGFDTACKTFSQAIGSLLTDCLSAKKYYFFIKLMGRSASHITLECALKTHPNLAFIGEEIAAQHKTLKEIVCQIADLICQRAEKKKNYGVILIPEGLIEFIPEIKTLIQELNKLLASSLPHLKEMEARPKASDKIEYILPKLSTPSQACFSLLPQDIQLQLLGERDPHGNVQVAKIETERLLITLVAQALAERKKRGSYSGSFNAQPLFYGYEGRSCLPSNFDSQYCYALGHVAALLVNSKLTGYMSCVTDLILPVEQWGIGGTPLTKMLAMEEREGEVKPVIQKALVDLKGKPFSIFSQEREKWRVEDLYCDPGAIQFFGPRDETDQAPLTLQYELLRPLA